MSELMDRAVIEMPYEMAMSNELSRRQFYARAQALLAERDALRDALQAIDRRNDSPARFDKDLDKIVRAALQGAQP